MNDNDKKEIIEALKQSLVPLIEDTIQKKVNGKIDNLARQVEENRQDMEPIVEGWKTVQGGKKKVK